MGVAAPGVSVDDAMFLRVALAGAGVRCSAVRAARAQSMRSAAVFSSTRATRLVPDRSDVVALREQPRQSDLCRVAPASAATAWTPRRCADCAGSSRGEARVGLRQSRSEAVRRADVAVRSRGRAAIGTIDSARAAAAAARLRITGPQEYSVCSALSMHGGRADRGGRLRNRWRTLPSRRARPRRQRPQACWVDLGAGSTVDVRCPAARVNSTRRGC